MLIRAIKLCEMYAEIFAGGSGGWWWWCRSRAAKIVITLFNKNKLKLDGR